MFKTHYAAIAIVASVFSAQVVAAGDSFFIDPATPEYSGSPNQAEAIVEGNMFANNAFAVQCTGSSPNTSCKCAQGEPLSSCYSGVRLPIGHNWNFHFENSNDLYTLAVSGGSPHLVTIFLNGRFWGSFIPDILGGNLNMTRDYQSSTILMMVGQSRVNLRWSNYYYSTTGQQWTACVDRYCEDKDGKRYRLSHDL